MLLRILETHVTKDFSRLNTCYLEPRYSYLSHGTHQISFQTCYLANPIQLLPNSPYLPHVLYICWKQQTEHSMVANKTTQLLPSLVTFDQNVTMTVALQKHFRHKRH